MGVCFLFLVLLTAKFLSLCFTEVRFQLCKDYPLYVFIAAILLLILFISYLFYTRHYLNRRYFILSDQKTCDFLNHFLLCIELSVLSSGLTMWLFELT